MDYKQLSEKYKAIKSPENQQNSSKLYGKGKNGLLETIKKEDTKSKKQAKRFYIITSVVAVLYFIIFIVNTDPDLSLKNRLAGSCYIIASLILAFLFRKKHNKIKTSFYLAPTKEFLYEAKKRFQLGNKQQLWLVLVILLVDIASFLSSSNYFYFLGTLQGIVTFQVLFIGLLVLGLFFGKKEWSKNKKPIVDKIDKMLVSFDEQ